MVLLLLILWECYCVIGDVVNAFFIDVVVVVIGKLVVVIEIT